MPWRRRGREIQVKRGGKWRHKATAGSLKKAKDMLRILNKWYSDHKK
jgi:hypothetical protein